MGLLSFLQRKIGDASAGQDAGSVDAARGRARRRLIGATVLVLVGVIGLPLLFDTAPRPLPVDIPIDIPRKEAVPPLVAKVPPVAPKAASVPRPESAPAEAARETPAEPAPPPAAKAPEKPAEKAAEKPADKPADKPAPLARDPAAEAARAQAALEGKPVAAAKPGDAATRFVVQVGAFSEADSAREVRAKVEKLGLKTYTQVVETSAGKRIRVRVGPYSDRAEAEKIAAQIKQAGVSSAVLTL